MGERQREQETETEDRQRETENKGEERERLYQIFVYCKSDDIPHPRKVDTRQRGEWSEAERETEKDMERDKQRGERGGEEREKREKDKGRGHPNVINFSDQLL